MKPQKKYSLKGVAFYCPGEYEAHKDGKQTKVYQVWRDMFSRCYAPAYKGVTYGLCTVCEDWRYFQNFAKWFYENYKDGYHLDKDLLVKGNTHYSPDNCVFVPAGLNKILVDRRNHRGPYPQGVSQTSTSKSFQVKLSKKGVYHRLGSYATVQEAFLVYKTEKEKHVKEVAKEHLDSGLIDEKLYNAIISWEL